MVNVAYVSRAGSKDSGLIELKMIVVPEDLQVTSSNVAREFFAATLGQVNPENTSPARILSAFMAISSFGNIMVMTFVAARGM
jgi:hypothetical protein